MTVHGRDLDIAGLLDVLWLAGLTGGEPAAEAAPSTAGAADTSVPSAVQTPAPVVTAGLSASPADVTGSAASPAPPPGPPLPLEDPASDWGRTGTAPDSGSARPGSTVGAPAARTPAAAATATTTATTFGPALKPLHRKVPRPGATVLDADRSARASAESGHVVVVTRPVRERWLDLALVVDVSSSMGVWRQEVARICRVMRRAGVFRDVRVWRLLPDDDGSVTLRSPSGQRHRPSELIDPAGRRLIVLVTDAVDSRWRTPGPAAVLRRWAAHNPVVVQQVLPSPMWHLTALPPVRRRPRHAGFDAAGPPVPQRSDWIPIIATEPGSVRQWATALAGHRLHRTVLPTVPVRYLPLAEVEPIPPAGEPTAGQQVADFQSLCSAGAFELAGHLAVAPFTLPIARTVQRLFLPAAQPFHLAEVLLSGLVERIKPPPAPDEDPDTVLYDFVPGIREELLRTLTRRQAFDILDALADRSAGLAGSIGTVDLYALAEDPGYFLDRFPDSRMAASAAVAVLGALGGPYAEAADRLTGALAVAAEPAAEARPEPSHRIDLGARAPSRQVPMFEHTAHYTMSRNNEMPYAGVAATAEPGLAVLYGKRPGPSRLTLLVDESDPGPALITERGPRTACRQSAV